MMMVSACPKCHDQVTVPQGASSESRVRCPLCQEEYSLGEIFDALPPTLVLLDSPGLTHALPASDSEDYSLAPAAVESAPAAFQFEEASAPQTASRPSYAVASRPRRRQKSPLVEMLKIAGGGVVGLVLAQLILWWLPASVRRDPVNIGPQVARYLPWIVPAKFHGGPVPTADGDTDNETDSGEIREFDFSVDNEATGDSTPGGDSTTGGFDFRGGEPVIRKPVIRNPGNGDPAKGEPVEGAPVEEDPATGADDPPSQDNAPEPTPQPSDDGGSDGDSDDTPT